MNQELMKKYLAWKEKTKDTNNKNRKVSHARHMANQDNEWQARHAELLKRMNSDPHILEERRKRNRENGQSVTGPQGSYETVKDFQQTNGMNFQDKLRLLPHLYYYTEKGPGQVKYETVYYSPLFTYCNTKEIYKVYLEKGLVEERFLTLKFKPWLKWFAYMEKTNSELFYKKKEPKRDWLLETGMAPRVSDSN